MRGNRWKLLTVAALALAGASCLAQPLDWTTAAPMPVGKAGHVAGVVDGRALVAGGTVQKAGEPRQWSGDLFVYDPSADEWSRGPAMPFPLSHGAGTAVGNRLYVVSGSDGVRDYPETIICSRQRGEYHWLWGPPLPAPRLHGVAVAVGTKLYVLGGAPDRDMKGRFYNDGLVLDTARPRDGWKAIRAMPGPGRVLMAATAVGETITLFGGGVLEREGFRYSNDAFEYDTARDRWRRLPSLPFSVRGMEAVTVREQVYLLGGHVRWPPTTGRPAGFNDRVLRFDRARGEYVVVGDLTEALMGPRLRALPDNRVFLAGGEDPDGLSVDLAALVRLP